MYSHLLTFLESHLVTYFLLIEVEAKLVSLPSHAIESVGIFASIQVLVSQVFEVALKVLNSSQALGSVLHVLSLALYIKPFFQLYSLLILVVQEATFAEVKEFDFKPVSSLGQNAAFSGRGEQFAKAVFGGVAINAFDEKSTF